MNKLFSGAKIFFIIITLLILLGIVAALQKSSPSLENSLRSNILDTETSSSAPQDAFSYATTTISAPNADITAQIADTADKQTQGLSDRSSLPEGTGMLFVFDSPSPQYMWMKDMNFSLDMVWLDQNKKVTYVATDISPDTYTTIPPKVFSSPVNALYVLEIPSGDANRLGIIVGKTLSFTSSN